MMVPSDTPPSSPLAHLCINSIVVDGSPSTVEVVLTQKEEVDDFVAKGIQHGDSRVAKFQKGVAALRSSSQKNKKMMQVVPTPPPAPPKWRFEPLTPPSSSLFKSHSSKKTNIITTLDFRRPTTIWSEVDTPTINLELLSTYKVPNTLATLVETTLKHATSTIQHDVACSPPSSSWSEPVASTMNVRGKDYKNDRLKTPSESSLFTVLGVDSFVNSEEVKDHYNASWGTDSFRVRWNEACDELGLARAPFLLVINFIVPWGNFQAYLIRADADDNEDDGGPFISRHINRPSERSWRAFMEGSTEYRNEHFKLIPRVCAGPWMIKKLVGSTPARIGTKVPVTYRGSIDENFLEIIIDVTKGPALGNNIASTVVGKAELVTVDLGFVIEAQEDEQMLGLIRFHHLNMKTAPTHSQWKRNKNTMG